MSWLLNVRTLENVWTWLSYALSLLSIYLMKNRDVQTYYNVWTSLFSKCLDIPSTLKIWAWLVAYKGTWQYSSPDILSQSFCLNILKCPDICKSDFAKSKLPIWMTDEKPIEIDRSTNPPVFISFFWLGSPPLAR